MMWKEIKDWIVTVLGVTGIFSMSGIVVLGAVLAAISIMAGPVILVMWVAKKLFFS